MPRKTNKKIEQKHLILCEGRDEQEFLISYLNSAALSDIPAFSQDIQVIDFGGNSDLSAYLQLLQNSENFEKVESLLIIRDAERNVERAVCEVKSALLKNNFPAPCSPHVWEGQFPKIGYLFFPTCDIVPKEGTLEDLCLSILSGSNAPCLIKEIDLFLEQLKSNCQIQVARPFKTKLHTYFSICNEYVSLKIGEAARAGAFDWSSVRLEPLKNFLLEVLSGA